MKKWVGTALLATALMTSAVAPFNVDTTAQAVTKKQTSLQYKAVKTTAIYNSPALNSVVVTVPKGQYIQVIQTLKIKGTTYYKVKFTNYNADLDDLLWGEQDDTRVYSGYVKASHFKGVTHTYGDYKKLNDNRDYGVVPQYFATKDYNLRKNYRFGTVQRENNVVAKGERLIILGKRIIDGKTYVKVSDAAYHAYIGYIPKSLLKKVSINSTKTYSKNVQKTPYVTASETEVFTSYGPSIELDYTADPLEKGAIVYMQKEVTYKGKVYVYIKIKDSQEYGWVRGYKLVKK